MNPRGLESKKYKGVNSKGYAYLEYGVNIVQSQKVRWPENLARVGVGMWGEALNFLDLLLRFGSSQNEGQSGKTKMD